MELINYRRLQIADANGKIIYQQNVLQGMQYVNFSHLASCEYVLTVFGKMILLFSLKVLASKKTNLIYII